ncbi:Vacuolar protein sorting-associated protein 16 -like protein, partial [Trichinella pseudospiralis]|uniref:Vacuolar protein sorting-associated protein 16 homolog n=1 Tax=Trichinella pseudospiralis TaxID=6337 RepID=A0A0V1ESN5_TRIPS
MFCQTADWFPLGTETFQKLKIYDLTWNIGKFPLNEYAACSFGGNIAILNGDAETRRKYVELYNPSGKFISKFNWKNDDLLYMNWTRAEDLICVQSSGKVSVYSPSGEEKLRNHFHMGKEALEMKIISCQSFHSFGNATGLAVLCKTLRFYLVNDVEQTKLWRTREVHGKSTIPSCWVVISKERQTKVICAFDNEIYVLSRELASEQIIPPFTTPVRKYTSVILSPDKEKLAFMSDESLVQICSSDFKIFHCEFFCTPYAMPCSFYWCTDFAIFVGEGNSYSLTGLVNDTMNFSCEDSSFAVCQEPDGLRIYSRNKHEFIRCVNKSAVEIFRVGSLSPAAFLVVAHAEYIANSYKAFEYIRLILDQLPDAIQTCIDAATHFFDPSIQKRLLLAASFGKSFVPTVEVDAYTNACRTLRILNAIREINFAMPISYLQLKSLTLPNLINRLIAREQYPLAVSCCRYLRLDSGIGVNRVVMHWASKIVRDKSISDERIVDRIKEKSTEFPDISFASIAEIAAQHKRMDLATKLLNYEKNLERQVFMLMKLNRNEKALSKAAQSKDPELKSFEKISDLSLIMRNFPIPFTLYKSFVREINADNFRFLLEETDDFIGQALYHLKASNAPVFDITDKVETLQLAEKCFHLAKENFCVSQLCDNIKLLKFQEELAEKFNDSSSLVDCSLQETVEWLICANECNYVEMAKKEFKISDRQLCWWKMRAFAKASRWQDLENFAKHKKPPIGYLPFIQECMKYSNKEEAQKYFSKVTADDRLEALIILKNYESAANLAIQQRNEEALNRILSLCSINKLPEYDTILSLKKQWKKQKK